MNVYQVVVVLLLLIMIITDMFFCSSGINNCFLCGRPRLRCAGPGSRCAAAGPGPRGVRRRGALSPTWKQGAVWGSVAVCTDRYIAYLHAHMCAGVCVYVYVYMSSYRMYARLLMCASYSGCQEEISVSDLFTGLKP